MIALLNRSLLNFFIDSCHGGRMYILPKCKGKLQTSNKLFNLDNILCCLSNLPKSLYAPFKAFKKIKVFLQLVCHTNLCEITFESRHGEYCESNQKQPLLTKIQYILFHGGEGFAFSPQSALIFQTLKSHHLVESVLD